MKLAKNLERLGTESAFSVLAEAKALEAKGTSPYLFTENMHAVYKLMLM